MFEDIHSTQNSLESTGYVPLQVTQREYLYYSPYNTAMTRGALPSRDYQQYSYASYAPRHQGLGNFQTLTHFPYQNVHTPYLIFNSSQMHPCTQVYERPLQTNSSLIKIEANPNMYPDVTAFESRHPLNNCCIPTYCSQHISMQRPQNVQDISNYSMVSRKPELCDVDGEQVNSPLSKRSSLVCSTDSTDEYITDDDRCGFIERKESAKNPIKVMKTQKKITKTCNKRGVLGKKVKSTLSETKKKENLKSKTLLRAINHFMNINKLLDEDKKKCTNKGNDSDRTLSRKKSEIDLTTCLSGLTKSYNMVNEYKEKSKTGFPMPQTESKETEKCDTDRGGNKLKIKENKDAMNNNDRSNKCNADQGVLEENENHETKSLNKKLIPINLSQKELKMFNSSKFFSTATPKCNTKKTLPEYLNPKIIIHKLETSSDISSANTHAPSLNQKCNAFVTKDHSTDNPNVDRTQKKSFSYSHVTDPTYDTSKLSKHLRLKTNITASAINCDQEMPSKSTNCNDISKLPSKKNGLVHITEMKQQFHDFSKYISKPVLSEEVQLDSRGKYDGAREVKIERFSKIHSHTLMGKNNTSSHFSAVKMYFIKSWKGMLTITVLTTAYIAYFLM